jgi:hypothetical protein
MARMSLASANWRLKLLPVAPGSPLGYDFALQGLVGIGLATGSSSATGWVVVYCLSPNSIDILKNYQFARHSWCRSWSP